MCYRARILIASVYYISGLPLSQNPPSAPGKIYAMVLFLLVTNITALIGFWCLLVEFLAKTIWFTSKGERHLLYYQINYTKVNIITIITGKQLIIACL